MNGVLPGKENWDTNVERGKCCVHTIYELLLTSVVFPPDRIPQICAGWPLDEHEPASELFEAEYECPVDWSLFPHLDRKDIVAYEARRPWDARGPPFERLAECMSHKLNHLYSHEGVRKMFGRANLAVFKATGVYFLFSSLGLDKGREDIPTDKALLKKLADAGYPQTRVAKESKSGAKPLHALMQHAGPVTNVLLRAPGKAGYTHRIVPATIAVKCGIEDDVIINYSSDVFDRWYSCLCFGLRQSLPKRVYTLEETSDGSFEHVDAGVPPVTIHTLLDTYTLSQRLKTTNVSDMLLDELSNVLQREKALHKVYKGRGEICEDDPNDIVRFSDLAPEDIEKLWAGTKSRDPIRRLVVDLLTYRFEEVSYITTKNCLRSGASASKLYAKFAGCHNRQADIVDDFASTLWTEYFCTTYHNHDNDVYYYASPDSKPSTDSKKLIDDTVTAKSCVQMIEIWSELNGYVDCRNPDNTGGLFDVAYLQGMRPDIKWRLVKSFSVHVIFPHEGPQRREIVPLMADEEEIIDSRWPTHPGYLNADWSSPRPSKRRLRRPRRLSYTMTLTKWTASSVRLRMNPRMRMRLVARLAATPAANLNTTRTARTTRTRSWTTLTKPTSKTTASTSSTSMPRCGIRKSTGTTRAATAKRYMTQPPVKSPSGFPTKTGLPRSRSC